MLKAVVNFFFEADTNLILRLWYLYLSNCYEIGGKKLRRTKTVRVSDGKCNMNYLQIRHDKEIS
jgi:hypothetical protein